MKVLNSPSFNSFSLLLFMGIVTGLFCSVSTGYAQQLEDVDWTKAYYVSPGGDNTAAGTRDKPFATIQKAMSSLPATGGGVIALLGGTYKEQITIRRRADDKGEAELLMITAVPDEKVVFQGGEPIAKWTPWNGKKGLYVVEAPDRQGINEQTGYLDVWENSARVRYRSQFDAAGVEAYPGSVCLLDNERILVHTRDGRDPQAVDLWRNRAANGITLLRDNVVLRGIQFENYLGGSEARAITVGNNGGGNNHTGIVVADCTIVNSVRGLSMTANGARVVNCDIRDVGMGILSHGVDTVVEDCVIQSATDSFAISVLNQHQRDGIRLYLPANGGKVTNCITAGFWAGLYIKTDTGGAEARPMLIENNILLDGIRAGAISAETAPQPRNRYIGNIMGPDQERIDPMKDRALVVATFESNYFFNGGGTSKGSNTAGENPFVDLANGDLSIKPGIALPIRRSTPDGARKATQIKWSPRLAAALARALAPEKSVATELKFTKAPTAAASAQGAIISARLSTPAESALRYRKVGAADWQTVTGIDNTLSRPEVIIGSAPVARDATPEYGILFALLGGQLEANTDYEYFVEAAVKGATPLRSEAKTLRTAGGPKKIVVRTGSDTTSVNGTPEHPFAHLQDAFDCALPGDTIQLEKGVYTAPAILVHGGTAQAPLVIQGVGALETILDGGKEPPVMLELRQTGNIVIRDLQVRWFGNSGIAASETENVTVERCRFFNTGLRGSETPNGSGISINKSPGWTISHNIFAKMEFGIIATASPRLKLLNNTAFRNMYAGIYLVESSNGSTITGNSFTFTGNDSVVFREPDVAAFALLTCDYNNYGAVIRKAEKARPENEFKPAARYGHQGPSKAIISATINGSPNRFTRMEDWRKFSGLDAHSIFADPEYTDPLNTDFRLMSNSPNVLPNGKTIGAAPIAGQ